MDQNVPGQNDGDCDHWGSVDSNQPVSAAASVRTVPNHDHLPQHAQSMKRRRLQMNDVQCLSHSMTSAGAKPLTNPNHMGLSRRPSYDANKGLYPRQKLPKYTSSPHKIKRSPHSKQPLTLATSPMKQTHLGSYFEISPTKHALCKSLPVLSGNVCRDQYNTAQMDAINCSHGAVVKQETCSPQSFLPNRSRMPTVTVSPAGSCPGKFTRGSPASFSLNKKKPATLTKPTKLNQPQLFTQKIPAKSPPPCKGQNYNVSCRTSSDLKIGHAVNHTPVRSLFKNEARFSTDPVKAFEEDDFITPEMFDDVVGACMQNEDVNAKSSTSLEKHFEDDDSFTADDFDEAIRLSQSPAKHEQARNLELIQSPEQSPPPGVKPQHCVNIEQEFADDDSLTADDFDEVMRLSQSPVKTGPSLAGKSSTCQSKEIAAGEQDTNELGHIKCIAVASRNNGPSPLRHVPRGRRGGGGDVPVHCGDDQSPYKRSIPGTCTALCTFGLLGEDIQLSPEEFGEGDTSCTDFIARLPDEVLENILGELPILDLCLTATRVCKRWNALIKRPQFVPWKKRYHRLKKQQGSDEENEIKQLIEKSGKLVKRSCLIHLIKYVSTVSIIRPGSTDGIKLHPRFWEAVAVMKEKTSDVFRNEDPHPWSVVATLIILSETAQEVCQILDCLLKRRQPFLRMEVSECFYCIAASLFLFQRKFDINRGLHYRVFHALHKLESDGQVDIEELSQTADNSDQGQQSSLSGERRGVYLTPEQMRIINHELSPTDVVKIVAFAGTGKTTTLIRFAKQRPHLNFLYIAFNKTVQVQASKTFPQNVECRTLHSLAYRAVGFKFRSKMGSALKPYFITSLLAHVDERVLHPMTLAKHVCTTINRFAASADDCITTAHTPMWNTTQTPRQLFQHHVRMAIAEAAESVFAALCEPQNFDAKMTHDVYLKLYEMQRPELKGYDCLLIDEAQDLSEAQQSILLRQNCAKILVGDPHQQIYSFRGATNAMARVEATRVYQLTQSFRFGPEIAYVANCLLESLKDQTKDTMIGAGPPGCVLGESIGQVATICRSNVAVFNEAVRLVNKNDRTRIEFSGGLYGYGFDKILDIYYLSLPAKERGSYQLKDKFISRFTSLAALKSYAEMTEDNDLQIRIKLVLLHHSRIPSLVERIKRSAVTLNGDVLLTTAHKAKGLEFDTVQLTDDYIDQIADILGNKAPEDERNILYVAVTRAKKSLLLNQTLLKFLQGVQEKFEYPALAMKVRERDGPQRCQECGVVQEDPRQLLLLQRKHLVHAFQRRTVQAGIVCHKCVDAPGFEELYGKPALANEDHQSLESHEGMILHVIAVLANR